MTAHMNDFDLHNAILRFGLCAPNRGHVAKVVANLAEWADRYSDGWAFWPAPSRSAQQAIAQIESRTTIENVAQEQQDLTNAQVRRVLAPITAFCTRQIANGTMTTDQKNAILAG